MNDGKDWIVVDIEAERATFAQVAPGITSRAHDVRTYPTTTYTTPSDCFNAYARETNISLKDRQCCIIVAAAISGDSFRIPNSRWIISISGLGYILGSRPFVLNDSAAKAWANLDFSAQSHRSIGARGEPNFSSPGRWVAINLLEEGAGAALLICDAKGRIQETDSEIGHAGFVAENAIEQRLYNQLTTLGGRPSWEAALKLNEHHPIWNKIDVSQADIPTVRAEIFGAFAGDVTLALTGWSGVFMHGVASKILSSPKTIDAFNKRFEAKGFYSANLRAAPRWIVTMNDINLRGATRFIAHETKH